jgi:hypothetical protein
VNEEDIARAGLQGQRTKNILNGLGCYNSRTVAGHGDDDDHDDDADYCGLCL